MPQKLLLSGDLFVMLCTCKLADEKTTNQDTTLHVSLLPPSTPSLLPPSHTSHSIACRCPTNERTMPETREASEEYQAKLTALIDSGKYDSDDDFTVVIQPFFVNAQLPRDNVSQHSHHFGVHCSKSLKCWVVSKLWLVHAVITEWGSRQILLCTGLLPLQWEGTQRCSCCPLEQHGETHTQMWSNPSCLFNLLFLGTKLLITRSNQCTGDHFSLASFPGPAPLSVPGNEANFSSRFCKTKGHGTMSSWYMN